MSTKFWTRSVLGAIAILIGFVSSEITVAQSVEITPHSEPASVLLAVGSIEDSIQAAIPFLQREGVAWIEKQGCVSCHQVPFMLWSLNAAANANFDVDRELLSRWQAWSLDAENFVKPTQRPVESLAETRTSNIDTMSALMLAVADEKVEATKMDEFRSALVANQQDNGSWQACGQLPLQKRPVAETHAVTTMWVAYALANTGQAAESIEKAMNSLASTDTGQSAEWYVAGSLLASIQQGDTSEYLDALVAKQNPDGGWGWILGDASDAMATGMALYALQTASPALWQKERDLAVEYLLSTQRDDGVWSVLGTKKASKGRETPTAIYWGTAWSVIGLVAVHESRQ